MIQGVPKKTHHKDSNYVYLKFIYKIKIQELKKTSITKSVQLAIIRAFTALWEIKFEQMGNIWNFVSEDENKRR
jgi:hypothetical protein